MNYSQEAITAHFHILKELKARILKQNSEPFVGGSKETINMHSFFKDRGGRSAGGKALERCGIVTRTKKGCYTWNLDREVTEKDAKWVLSVVSEMGRDYLMQKALKKPEQEPVDIGKLPGSFFDRNGFELAPMQQEEPFNETLFSDEAIAAQETEGQTDTTTTNSDSTTSYDYMVGSHDNFARSSDTVDELWKGGYVQEPASVTVTQAIVKKKTLRIFGIAVASVTYKWEKDGK